MIVLHVITQLSFGGGAEAVLFRLVSADKDNTHVVVSLQKDDDYGELLRNDGVEVFALGMKAGGISPISIYRLWRIIRNTKPDVVQTWMYHSDLLGGITARLAGCKNIVWGIHHTTLDVKGSSRTARLSAWLCARISGFVPSRIISCSNAGVLAHKEMGYSTDNMVVCFNGYDVDEYFPRPFVEVNDWKVKQGIGSDEIVIGMVARWNKQKDHANLIKALEIFSKTCSDPWVCLLAGVEIDRSNEELNALIQTHGIGNRVKLLGKRTDVPDLMSVLDVHVLSSKFGEAFPNVLNEAMASGTPCITTRVGDSEYIVGDAGWVVEPSEPAQLAAALQHAVAEVGGAGWGERCARSRQRVESNFSIKAMVSAYAKIWTESLNSKFTG